MDPLQEIEKYLKQFDYKTYYTNSRTTLTDQQKKDITTNILNWSLIDALKYLDSFEIHHRIVSWNNKSFICTDDIVFNRINLTVDNYTIIDAQFY